MPNQIPLDPKLPKDFDSTPNEQRSKSELDAWWDHPFAITLDDGKLDVRCLNGGAWDRSTWLGTVNTYSEACELADMKQTEWVNRRFHPLMSMGETFDLVRMPQRPDQDLIVLASFKTQEESALYFKLNFPLSQIPKNI